MDPTAEEYLFLRTSRAHIRSFSTQCLCHIEYNTTALLSSFSFEVSSIDENESNYFSFPSNFEIASFILEKSRKAKQRGLLKCNYKRKRGQKRAIAATVKLSHLLLLCVLAKSGIIRLVEGLSTSSLINIRSAQRFSSLGCCLLADTLVQKYLPAPPVSFRMYKQGYSESLMLLTQRCVIGSSSSQLYLLANIYVILKMHSTIRNGTTLLIPRRICWNAMYFFP